MPTANPDPSRELDVVLFGATGFTGGLVAAHLAARAPEGLRWGLAGRSLERLEEVRSTLGRPDITLVLADVDDPASLAELAARTRVLATTVGPYLAHGEPLVKACAEAGTDYLDLTGEPEFVDKMFVAYDAVARRSGARIVHACGFDSIPYDLGVLYTVRRLERDGKIEQPLSIEGIVRAGAGLSGGTFHSALDQFARAKELAAAARARARVEEKPAGRTSRAVRGGIGRRLGYYVLPLPTIDPLIVKRSGAALDAYGPAFSYSHYAGVKTLRNAVGGALGVGGLVLAAQVPPVRERLKARVPQGSGPSERKRERSWFSVDLLAETGGRTLHTRVSGGDPGYTETSKMMAEAALCLALDDVPSTAGCVTTAMGDALLERLQAVGIRFQVVG